MCASVQAVALRIRPFLFYFQPGRRGTRGATSPTTLQCTQLKVDQPKSLLWWAKLLKTKLRCENKQRVASLRQAGPGRSLGGHLCGVLLPENGRRSFVNHCLEPRSKRRDRAELQANVRHFELSRKRIAARMRTCQCMSHFVYNLRSRPLVRDLAARVRGQIASDHCRSDLITGLTHWARAGYPFPEVNLPESATTSDGPVWDRFGHHSGVSLV